MSTIRATYVQHGSSAVPNITLNASGQVIVASGIVSSGTFAAPTGSAAAPGVYFVGDTNTGLYSPGADQVAVATNGTGRLFVDASGNVGVGGSAPNYSDHKTLSLFGAANNGAGFIQFTDTSNNADAAIFADDGSLFINADYDNTSSDSSIRFRVDGSSEKVRITSAGRVGIGTSQPVGQTYIAGPNTSNFGVAADAALNIAAASGALANRIINLNFAVVPSATNAVAAIGMAYGSQSGFGNGHLIFGTRSVTTDTAPTERMRIDSSGRVGIGTTSPSSYSAAGDNLVIADAGNCGITLAAGTSSTGQILFADGTTGADTIRGIIGYTHASNDLFFGTNAVERLRIDSSGRLLVGTSTARNIFDNLYAPRLQVEGTDATQALSVTINAASSDGSYFFLGKSRGASPGDTTVVQSGDRLGAVVFQGADGSKLIRAAQIESLVDGTPGTNDMPGRLVFSTTADGASSPTERLRIDSSGRVGIGTTSPSRRLTVNSTTTGNINYVRLQETTTNTPTNGGSFIELGGTRSNGTYGFYGGILGGRRFQGGDNTGYLAFYTDNNDGESLAERVRIDHLGRLLVGTSSARSNFFNTTASAALQIEGQGGAGDSRRVAIISNDNTAVAGGNLVLAHQRSGSVGGNTIVNINDIVGRLSYQGNDGAQFVEAASINCEVDGTPGANDMPGRLVFYTTADGASSPTERMRIKEDGVVAIGASDSPNGDILFASCATSRAAGFRVGPTAGTFAAVTFYDGINTDCGSIDINTTANTTAYTTSSDYRLKSNVQPLTGNLQRLAQLKPCKWEWLSAPEVSGEGFLAHEAQEVVPEAVTGTKDEVDENGNPVYQGIDQSKLVPLLTAALQEAIGEIESLKARLTAAGI
jgi:hypothetical protein